MGIKQLFSIIREEAPDAIKEGEIKHQFGRKVAIVSTTTSLQLCTELTLTGCVCIIAQSHLSTF